LELVPDESPGILSLLGSFEFVDHKPRFEGAAETGGDDHAAAASVGSAQVDAQILAAGAWADRSLNLDPELVDLQRPRLVTIPRRIAGGSVES
jgi:hypothetical protein